MWDITIHPPSGRSVSSLALFSSSSRCGTAPKSTPLWGPASLLAHHLVSTPLRDTEPPNPRGPASLLTHTSCLPPSGNRALKSTPLWDPASLLAHRLMSTSLRGIEPPNPPPLGPTVLTGTPPRVYPPSENSKKIDTSSDVWL